MSSKPEYSILNHQIKKYCENRIEAEQYIKFFVESISNLYTSADKIDFEGRKVNHVLEYTNDTLFEPINQNASSCFELIKQAEICSQKANTPQKIDFSSKFNTLVNRVVQGCLIFVGYPDSRSYFQFVSNFRGVIDVSTIHTAVFTKLQIAFSLPLQEAIKEIMGQVKLYLVMTSEKMHPVYRACSEGKLPELFSQYNKADLNSMKHLVDENAGVFAIVDAYFKEREQIKGQMTYNEQRQRRNALATELIELTANTNDALKAWSEQFINDILLKIT